MFHPVPTCRQGARGFWPNSSPTSPHPKAGFDSCHRGQCSSPHVSCRWSLRIQWPANQYWPCHACRLCSCHLMSCHVILTTHGKSCHCVTPCHAMPCHHVKPCHVIMSNHAMSSWCMAMQCHNTWMPTQLHAMSFQDTMREESVRIHFQDDRLCVVRSLWMRYKCSVEASGALMTMTWPCVLAPKSCTWLRCPTYI